MSIAQAQPAAAPASDAPRVVRGTAFVHFAYDVGFSIRLDDADRLLTGVKQRGAFKSSRRLPPSLQIRSAPLRLTQAASPLPVGEFATADAVEAVLYDFGAVSIAFSIPLRGPLLGLRELSADLYDNAALRADARRRVDQLLDAVRSCVSKPHVCPLVEDYAVFHVAEWAVGASAAARRPAPAHPPGAAPAAADPEALLRAYPGELAQVLRAERAALSDEEVADALAARTSCGATDLALIDWNAALVLDPDADDIRTVLEYANVELLEMRFLDQQLDATLEQAYESLGRGRWWPLRTFGSAAHDLRRIGRLQADSAVLFEGVDNVLKLVGDQYLARVYRTVSQRLRLPEWDASILRKLETLESIYSKMSDQQSTRRMEVLEWIIIVLIAVSIALPFVGAGK